MDKHEVIAERAKTLARITEHPDWQHLRDEYERKRDRHRKRLASMILDRPDQTVVQREIDYIAGFWAGAQWVLNTPALAERTLEDTLKRADLLKEAGHLGRGD